MSNKLSQPFKDATTGSSSKLAMSIYGDKICTAVTRKLVTVVMGREQTIQSPTCKCTVGKDQGLNLKIGNNSWGLWATVHIAFTPGHVNINLKITQKAMRVPYIYETTTSGLGPMNEECLLYYALSAIKTELAQMRTGKQVVSIARTWPLLNAKIEKDLAKTVVSSEAYYQYLLSLPNADLTMASDAAARSDLVARDLCLNIADAVLSRRTCNGDVDGPLEACWKTPGEAGVWHVVYANYTITSQNNDPDVWDDDDINGSYLHVISEPTDVGGKIQWLGYSGSVVCETLADPKSRKPTYHDVVIMPIPIPMEM